MKRELIKSPGFIRDLRRWSKMHPRTLAEVEATLLALAEDARQPALRTHKLKGNLSAYWTCSGGYDVRVMFEFITHGGEEAILLHGIGTHDDIY